MYTNRLGHSMALVNKRNPIMTDCSVLSYCRLHKDKPLKLRIVYQEQEPTFSTDIVMDSTGFGPTVTQYFTMNHFVYTIFGPKN